MSADDFKFLSSEEFSRLSQDEKLTYLADAVKHLAEYIAGSVAPDQKKSKPH